MPFAAYLVWRALSQAALHHHQMHCHQQRNDHAKDNALFSPQLTTTAKDTKSLDADNGWRLIQALGDCTKCMDELSDHTG
ncbi:MAG: hypothetical protein ACRD72_08450 [Candidatus Angelobacter sp.]